MTIFEWIYKVEPHREAQIHTGSDDPEVVAELVMRTYRVSRESVTVWRAS